MSLLVQGRANGCKNKPLAHQEQFKHVQLSDVRDTTAWQLAQIALEFSCFFKFSLFILGAMNGQVQRDARF